MYAFALRPRWILLHLLALAAVALFALAGVWQLQRLSERREHNALVAARRSAAPLRSLGADPDSAEHRRARVEGRYDTGRELILLGRSNNERPGNHVLTPLLMPGGRAVLVDRGWVPAELESPPVVEALPPDGRVEVTGILLRGEGSGPLGTAPARIEGRRVSRIDVERIARTLPYRTFPFYLVLRRQEPAQSDDLPVPASFPRLGEGPHLIYAIQWFCFIPIAIVGYGAIVRREASKRVTAQSG